MIDMGGPCNKGALSGGYGYGSDLRKYPTDNDAPKPLLEMFGHAIIHDENNRDFSRGRRSPTAS